MAEYREIVIKIPEEIISSVKCNDFLPANYLFTMGRVLLDGVELPKGHGRLIDADELCKGLMKRWNTANERLETLISEVMSDVVTPIVVSTPTIIEADKGE